MEVPFNITSSFKKHYFASLEQKFFIISQGGGRSGKTYSILQNLVFQAIINPYKNLIISVVAETFPVLKRGAIRDFQSIMMSCGLWDSKHWNKSESQYILFGNTIEFFSCENADRARGPARDYLFINEANNVKYETAFQLIARTSQKCYLDFNPTGEFWAHTEIMQNDSYLDKYVFLKTTFKDNEYLDESIKEVMLARASKDPNYKRIYVDGEVGLAQGVIYTEWEQVDFIPEEKKIGLQWIGVDFGWNDPTSINSMWIPEPGEIWVDEKFYRGEVSNKQIIGIIKNSIESTQYKVIADSSEPKAIDEIYSAGINVFGVSKPPGSVNFGIDLLKGWKIYVTKNSINTIKELRNYKWLEDKNGLPVKDSKGRPVPTDYFNHSLDNIRYVAFTYNDQKFEYKPVPRRKPRGLVAV